MRDLRVFFFSRHKKKNLINADYRFKKHNDIKTLVIKDAIQKDIPDSLTQFKQCLLKTKVEDIQILLNKNMVSTIKIAPSSLKEKTTHNRHKKHLIPDGEPCPFLIEIGVMDESGNVKSNYYKKFRQINRFLEMVDDLYKETIDKKYHIIDFGCGKSYLTFALYHYFSIIRKVQVQITGVDLKTDVIKHCNKIATSLKYDKLTFVHGLIHDFKSDTPIDFVVTLHACDTATDDAIIFALKNQAEKMMFIPCCQHELSKQLKSTGSSSVIKHGILKERLTAIITDSVRSQLLKACGYRVQVMEFIDLEHTAKNILLRCSKAKSTEVQRHDAYKEYQALRDEWGLAPYLESELKKEGLLKS